MSGKEIIELCYRDVIYDDNHLLGKYKIRDKIANQSHKFYYQKAKLDKLSKRQGSQDDHQILRINDKLISIEQRIEQLKDNYKSHTNKDFSESSFDSSKICDDDEDDYDDDDDEDDYYIYFFKNDYQIFDKLQTIFNKYFKKSYLHLYGGLIRDRAFSTMHEKTVKINDYDFVVPENIIYKLKNRLEQHNFHNIRIQKITPNEYKCIKVLYADYKYKNVTYSLNFKAQSSNFIPSDDYKSRDFTVNNLTCDLLKSKIVYKKQAQTAIQDIQQKVIDIVNDFDHTFFEQEVRFLRLLVLIGKGYSVYEDLYNELNEKTHQGYFDFDMNQNHLMKYMDKLMQQEYLGRVFDTIYVFGTQEILLKSPNNEFILFLEINKEVIVDQLQELRHLQKIFQT